MGAPAWLPAHPLFSQLLITSGRNSFIIAAGGVALGVGVAVDPSGEGEHQNRRKEDAQWFHGVTFHCGFTSTQISPFAAGSRATPTDGPPSSTIMPSIWRLCMARAVPGYWPAVSR